LRLVSGDLGNESATAMRVIRNRVNAVGKAEGIISKTLKSKKRNQPAPILEDITSIE